MNASTSTFYQFFSLGRVVRKLLTRNAFIVYLSVAGLLFAIGQIFEYVISTHLCQATHGRINGALFETLFTLLGVVTLWIFWSSITEDDWPMPATPGAGYT